ncbi:hypothetical protein K458DRAFT_436410 [Lentithecium fluviatile CBS 122367]|uniref:Mid2 domain-containing protein n=1 Tax=Lentithecium fluviatile CBS 122367 TaxID=1168545 RepID=A0A6G1IID3_9PLEO|nr:hypothetical protein K458DRAFT_436410 [Lentithecium fluviatile CBS 122367]
MQFGTLLALLLIGLSGIDATDAPNHYYSHILPRQNSASLTRSPWKSASHTPTRTRDSASASSSTPTATKVPRPKQTGLKKPAKIGIAVGVPLGVAAIGGAIAAYIVGKRRGRKRRVDDPTAGANKLIKDPSNELNISPPTPAVAELPTVTSQEFDGQRRGSSTWWNPFARSGSTKRGYTVPPNAPQSPQEMPA